MFYADPLLWSKMFFDLEKPIEKICSINPVTVGEKDKITKILDLMLVKKHRKMPVADSEGKLKGLVTSVDMLDVFGGGDKHRIFKKHRSKTEAMMFMEKNVVAFEKNIKIGRVIEIFHQDRKGLYPLLEDGKIFGVISEWDFVGRINRKTGVKVYDLMVEKPMFVKENCTISDVIKMMCRGGFRRLPVVKENLVMGIVVPSDILSYIKKKGIKGKMVSHRTAVSAVMNKEVITAEPEEDISEIVKKMRENKIGGMPVTEDDELIGIITERDILDAFI